MMRIMRLLVDEIQLQSLSRLHMEMTPWLLHHMKMRLLGMVEEIQLQS
jgi:hypothetical protein